MKRHIAAALSILAVAGGVGWKLSSRPETSARLNEISLKQGSEHSQAGPTALARVRVRVMPSDFQISATELARIRIRVMPSDGYQINATADKVPQITLAAE